MPKRRGPQFRYQLINHRPSNQFTSPVEWDAFITSNLVDLLDKEPAVRSVKTETEEYRELFDEYILFQAKTLGWRILLSTGVQFRMSRWDFQESGPEKYCRLGEALGNHSLLVQKKRRLPITDPEWYQDRKATTKELALVLAQLADFAKGCREKPNSAKLATKAASYLDQRRFPLLWRSRANLIDFVRQGAGGWMGKLGTGERVSPTQFYDAWWGERLGRDPEGFRQDVSSLGSETK